MNLRLENLTKRHGSQVAVDRLNLEARDGEFLVVLGPSGCGKTTTLRMIAGLEQPDDGRIWLGDRDITALEPRNRDVAMVFQSYALYPHLTVEENIAFPLRIRKVPQETAAQRVRDAAAKLGLTRLLDRRPRALSGGERQRVALARAIVRQPNAFLMDEPLSNLDAQLRLETRAELKRLQHELGVTTVYVTHDQAEAMTLAHRVAVLSGGILQQLDTPVNVYNQPVNLFVAGFLGSPPMNLLQGLLDASGTFGIDGQDQGQVQWPLQMDMARAGSDRLVMGIRPEHVRLQTVAAPGAVSGRVYVTEPAGNENFVVVKLGKQSLTARVSADTGLEYDQEVWVSAPAARLHFFDQASGRRILSAGAG
jgi:multiple sugar transport system ATP-binding protein